MKYCQKHNQEYYNYLHDCPICVGETIKPHEYSSYKKIQPESPKENKPRFKRKLTSFKL